MSATPWRVCLALAAMRGLAHLSHWKAVAMALLVTLLWSSSYVIVKIGLREITPLGFAALRYLAASLFLWPLAFSRRNRSFELARQSIPMLVALGLAGYTFAQGLNFVGLYFLTAITTTFLLNFTPIAVAILGITVLGERPSSKQVIGALVAFMGALVYFSGVPAASSFAGILIVLTSGVAWAFYLVLTRKYQQGRHQLGPLEYTTLTTSIGSVGLLALALTVEGIPAVSMNVLAFVLWLAGVNTALAFLLWTICLRFVRAFELSMIQNTMLLQVGVLSAVFLGEAISGNMVAGMALVLIGVAVVQLAGARISGQA